MKKQLNRKKYESLMWYVNIFKVSKNIIQPFKQNMVAIQISFTFTGDRNKNSLYNSQEWREVEDTQQKQYFPKSFQ